MPCRLSDEEIAQEEKNRNKERFGLALSDAAVATEVACMAMKFIEAHCASIKPKPPLLARKWWEEHKQRDKERQRSEESYKRQQEEDEKRVLRRLKMKYPDERG